MGLYEYVRSRVIDFIDGYGLRGGPATPITLPVDPDPWMDYCLVQCRSRYPSDTTSQTSCYLGCTSGCFACTGQFATPACEAGCSIMGPPTGPTPSDPCGNGIQGTPVSSSCTFAGSSTSTRSGSLDGPSGIGCDGACTLFSVQTTTTWQNCTDIMRCPNGRVYSVNSVRSSTSTTTSGGSGRLAWVGATCMCCGMTQYEAGCWPATPPVNPPGQGPTPSYPSPPGGPAIR
jgi:hypothetical protein